MSREVGPNQREWVNRSGLGRCWQEGILVIQDEEDVNRFPG